MYKSIKNNILCSFASHVIFVCFSRLLRYFTGKQDKNMNKWNDFYLISYILQRENTKALYFFPYWQMAHNLFLENGRNCCLKDVFQLQSCSLRKQKETEQ